MHLLLKFEALLRRFFDPGVVFAAPSLLFAAFVAVSFLAWRQYQRRGRIRLDVIRRAVLRKNILRHRSMRADLGFWFLNTFAIGGLIGWAAFSAIAIHRFVGATLRGAFGPVAPSAAPDFVLSAGLTLLLFLAYEFGYWVDHYLSHRIPWLWEFHKTHHSAEVLSPVTVWRVHPIDTLVFANLSAVITGVVGGVAVYLIGREAPIFAVSGTNILLLFFVYAYIHLQHSQFWIPITGPLGRVLMSPAHHQIHHSTDPTHFNCNFGSGLSLWDWLFGTLAMPSREPPRLVFGADYGAADPHSVRTLLLTPFTAAKSALKPPPTRQALPVPAGDPGGPAPGWPVAADPATWPDRRGSGGARESDG